MTHLKTSYFCIRYTNLLVCCIECGKMEDHRTSMGIVGNLAHIKILSIKLPLKLDVLFTI